MLGCRKAVSSGHGLPPGQARFRLVRRRVCKCPYKNNAVATANAIGSGDTKSAASQVHEAPESRACTERQTINAAPRVAASVAFLASRNASSDAIPISTGTTTRTSNGSMSEGDHPNARPGTIVSFSHQISISQPSGSATWATGQDAALCWVAGPSQHLLEDGPMLARALEIPIDRQASVDSTMQSVKRMTTQLPRTGQGPPGASCGPPRE